MKRLAIWGKKVGRTVVAVDVREKTSDVLRLNINYKRNEECCGIYERRHVRSVQHLPRDCTARTAKLVYSLPRSRAYTAQNRW
jgi:hypothetical protein